MRDTDNMRDMTDTEILMLSILIIDIKHVKSKCILLFNMQKYDTIINNMYSFFYQNGKN